jgi:hypothetical protein
VFDHLTVLFAQCNGLVCNEFATQKTTYGDTSDKGRKVEGSHQHLGVPFSNLWFRDIFNDVFQQCNDVGSWVFPVMRHPVVFGGAKYDREVKLFFGSAQGVHQVEHLFVRPVRVAVGFVYLINDYDGFFAHLQCLLQYETGLRHRAFEGIHQEEHTVGHVEYTFHLATEVGVTWGVDDVDFCSLKVDGNVFGEDGDATLTLEVVVVEHQIAGHLVFLEDLGSEDHFVYQGGLTVVYVGDDCDVANILHGKRNDERRRFVNRGFKK